MSMAAAEKDVEGIKNKIAELRRTIASAEGQIADLEAQAIKVSNYIEMARIYEPPGLALSRSFTSSPVDMSAFNGTASVTTIAPSHSKQRRIPPRIVEESIQILKEKHHPIKTRDLIEELKKSGIPVYENNPITTLSSMLSRWKDILTPNRTDGWKSD